MKIRIRVYPNQTTRFFVTAYVRVKIVKSVQTMCPPPIYPAGQGGSPQKQSALFD
ncbi:hypothetical protein GCM10028825_53520 [Spirosoma agri]